MTVSNFHEQRLLGIGGSDVAPILGFPGFHTAYGIWLTKTGQAEPDTKPNPVAEVGHLLEAAVLLWGAIDAGCTVEAGEHLIDPKRAWMRGNTDGVYRINDRKEGAEAKVMIFSEAQTHELSHEFQSRWYMMLADVERWHLVALELPRSTPMHTTIAIAQAETPAAQLAILKTIKYAKFSRRIIERDRRIEKIMVERCGAWWQRHVVEGVEPEPDGSKEAGRHLSRRHADHDEEWLRDEDVGALVLEYKDHQRSESNAKADKERVGQLIKHAIGDNQGARGRWGSCRWSRFTNRSTDWAKLRAERPDVAAVIDEYTTHTPTGRLYPKLEK